MACIVCSLQFISVQRFYTHTHNGFIVKMHRCGVIYYRHSRVAVREKVGELNWKKTRESSDDATMIITEIVESSRERKRGQ